MDSREQLQADLDHLASVRGWSPEPSDTWLAEGWRVGVVPSGDPRFAAFHDGELHEFSSLEELEAFVYPESADLHDDDPFAPPAVIEAPPPRVEPVERRRHESTRANHCIHCGQQLPAGSAFCPSCGANQAMPAAPAQQQMPPGYVPPPQDRRRSRAKGCLIALAAVGVLLAIVSVAAMMGDDDEPSNVATDDRQAEPAGKRLYPGRVDAQPEDQERKVGGDGATIKGVTASVSSARFAQSINDFQKDGYIVADVSLRNGGDGTQSYNALDWKAQFPSGEVKDLDFVVVDGSLEYGDLVAGGSTSGKIAFTVNDAKGDFYLIWKPDAFDAARGIWKVSI